MFWATTEFHPNRINPIKVVTSHRFIQDGGRDIAISLRSSFLATLGRNLSTTKIPNFGDISLFMADILLLPVSAKKRLPCWNSTFGFDFQFTFASSSACHSVGLSACQISSKSDDQRHSYTSYPFSQNGSHGIAILLPVSFFVTTLI